MCSRSSCSLDIARMRVPSASGAGTTSVQASSSPGMVSTIIVTGSLTSSRGMASAAAVMSN